MKSRPISGFPVCRITHGRGFWDGDGCGGQEYSYEVNYRELKAHFQSAGKGLLPLVPYSPEETRRIGDGTKHPSPPNFEARHFLGTDPIGQDIFARLFYGFRITLIFAVMFTLVVYLIGVVIGCLMGYYGS